jgi:predicted Zn-dependent peptidase
MKPKYYNFEFNKAKICLYPMANVRAAYLELWITAGSAQEKGKNWGALHLIEHMFYQGTRKFENNHELELFQEEHGLLSNAWTGPMDMGLWIKFPKKETDAAIELLEETIFNSTLPEKELNREIDVIDKEYKGKWSNQYNRFTREYGNFLFGEGHIANRDGIGQPDYLRSLSRNALLSTRKKIIQPQNMIVVASGDIDIDYLSKKLKNVFLKQKNSGKQSVLTKQMFAYSKNPKHYFNHIESVENVELNITWLSKGWREYEFKDKYALWIANYLLNSTRGPIYEKLRQEMGLVYKAGFGRRLLEYLGMINLWASTDSQRLVPSYIELNKIIQNFVKKEIPYSNFIRAKNFISTQAMMSHDGVVQIAEKMAGDMYEFKRALSPDEEIKMLSRVTENQVRKVVLEAISGQPYVLIMSSKALPEWESQIKKAKI